MKQYHRSNIVVKEPSYILQRLISAEKRSHIYFQSMMSENISTHSMRCYTQWEINTF